LSRNAGSHHFPIHAEGGRSAWSGEEGHSCPPGLYQAWDVGAGNGGVKWQDTASDESIPNSDIGISLLLRQSIHLRSAPINTLPDPGNHANYLDQHGTYTTGSPYYRTNVGQFANSASPYGTFDQGGNVFEWTETAGGPTRLARGGTFDGPSDLLLASQSLGYMPAYEAGSIGFRVASLAPQLPGDYNGNGVVDAADYTIWRDTLGSTTDLRSNGDNTGGSAGIINQADYNFWKANFGTHSGSGASGGLAVPDPSTAASLVIGCAVALMARRR
jgi:hypothetical protein